MVPTWLPLLPLATELSEPMPTSEKVEVTRLLLSKMSGPLPVEVFPATMQLAIVELPGAWAEKKLMPPPWLPLLPEMVQLCS